MDYFTWLMSKISGTIYDVNQYSMMIEELRRIPFVYTIPMDANRVANAAKLPRRWSFEEFHGKVPAEDILCVTVFDVLLQLAIDGEDAIGEDEPGKMTAYLFWMMIANMGLSGMTNDIFDANYVQYCAQRMMRRAYNADGTGGGPIIVSSQSYDMRNAELWIQMCLCLDQMEGRIV